MQKNATVHIMTIILNNTLGRNRTSLFLLLRAANKRARLKGQKVWRVYYSARYASETWNRGDVRTFV